MPIGLSDEHHRDVDQRRQRAHRQLGDLHIEHDGVPGHHDLTEPPCRTLLNSARWMSTRSCWRTARRGTGSSSLVKRRRQAHAATRSTNSSSCTSGCRHTCRWCGRPRRTRFWSDAVRALVAQARSAVTGAHAPLWSEFVRFWTVSFPVVAYRAWRWWLATALAFFLVAVVIGVWVVQQPRGAGHPRDPERDRRNWSTTTSPSYYSEHPAASFALQVWVNNAWVAAQCIAFAILLGIPIPFILFQNAANLGVDRRPDVRRGQGRRLPRPAHAARPARTDGGVPGGRPSGMRLGWSVVSPGNRPRGQVLAEQGRAVVAVAVGPGRRAAGVGADRGVGHAVAAADVRAHRHRGRGRGRLPRLRHPLRPQGRAGGRDR